MWAVAMALVVMTALAVLTGIVGGVTQLASVSETPPSAGVPWQGLLRTVGYGLAIGGLATVLGLPGAWLLRRASPVWVAFLLVPLAMPMYLAYAGWGLLRAPGSWLGDWLGRSEPWVSVLANQVLAVLGLALWATPLAVIVVGSAARRVPQAVLDALALEPWAPLKKAGVLGGLLWPSVIGSTALVGVVVSGSAVPLHLAQVPTYAIELWKWMNLTPEPGGVWIQAVPLLAIGLAAAWAIVQGMHRATDRPVDQAADPASARSRWPAILALTVWLLAVGVPLGMFVAKLEHWRSMTEFWGLVGSGLIRSAAIAGLSGLLIALIGLASFGVASIATGSGLKRIGLVSGVGLVWMALVPGVLLGLGMLGFWNAAWMPRVAMETVWPVVWAHVARFGAIGVLFGMWLSRLESADERGARLLAAGDSLRGWWMVLARPNLAAFAGLGIAGAALSLHEIESTIMIQTPGPTSLAQYVLDQLHYARTEQLCAACICVIGMALLAASMAAGLITWTFRTTCVPRRAAGEQSGR